MQQHQVFIQQTMQQQEQDHMQLTDTIRYIQMKQILIMVVTEQVTLIHSTAQHSICLMD